MVHHPFAVLFFLKTGAIRDNTAAINVHGCANRCNEIAVSPLVAFDALSAKVRLVRQTTPWAHHWRRMRAAHRAACAVVCRESRVHYRRQLTVEYTAHSDEHDPQVLEHLRERGLEQAQWLLRKYAPRNQPASHVPRL